MSGASREVQRYRIWLVPLLWGGVGIAVLHTITISCSEIVKRRNYEWIRFRENHPTSKQIAGIPFLSLVGIIGGTGAPRQTVREKRACDTNPALILVVKWKKDW